MRKLFLLALQLGILGILVVWNNVLGLDTFNVFGFQFYERFAWWDIVSHVLGGLWVGVCVAWLSAHFGFRITLARCVLAAIAIGMAWEVFEYIEDMQGSPYWSTEWEIVKDLVNDAIGGYIGGYLATFRRARARAAQK